MRKPDEILNAPPTGGSPDAPKVSLAAAAAPQENSPTQAGSHQLLRHEIRVWTRDLLIAIGLALVIIVFLYQPVKVEGTSMAPLLSDQERIFINKFVYRFEDIHRGDVVVSGTRWTARNRLSSASSVCREKPWRSAAARCT